MTNGINKWKRPDLILAKKEINRSSNFCCIALARIAFVMDGQLDEKDGQMMSNAIVANRLLAAEASKFGLDGWLDEQTMSNTIVGNGLVAEATNRELSF